jgi:transcriptional regulator with XRE-family HTH domain
MAVNTTASRLTQAMEIRGTDQSALARDLNVTQGSISKIVLGRTSNSRLLPRIAAHLGVSMTWLLGLSDNPYDDGGGQAELSWEERDFISHLKKLNLEDRRALLRIARSLASSPEAVGTVHDVAHEYRAPPMGADDVG